MAVCDARYSFTLFNVGERGSNNDSGILQASAFGNAFEDGLFNIPPPEKIPGCELDVVPYFLVGDEIFPLKNWLLRPYPGTKKGTLTEPKSVFNYRLSRARRVIENTFGILVARWRIFRAPIKASVENIDKYVLATLSLHNYLRQTENAGYCPLGFVDREDADGNIKPGEWRSEVQSGNALLPLKRKRHNTRYTDSAITLRDSLKTYLNGPGSVPWQVKYVRRTGRDSDSDSS